MCAYSALTLVGNIESVVEPGSTVYTDEASAYTPLGRHYDRQSVKHSRSEYVRGDVHVNGMEAVWSILKRFIHGTWHHVSPKHLGRYVNEATFRLNEGNCEIDTIDRIHSRPKSAASASRTTSSRPRTDCRPRFRVCVISWRKGSFLVPLGRKRFVVIRLVEATPDIAHTLCEFGDLFSHADNIVPNVTEV